MSGASVILADEPTGALDSDNTARIAGILAGPGRAGLAVVVATHDGDVAAHVDRCFRLTDGKLGALE